MLRDITIGQYIPGDTIVHRLDPRVKIILTLLFIIALFFVKRVPTFLFMFLFIALVVWVSKTPPRVLIKGLKSMAVFIGIALFFNVFFYRGGTVLFEWKFIQITEEGLIFSLFMFLRIIFLIVGSSLMTLTTTPIELTDGLESLMSPLKRFGFPAGELAMMMSISLRYVPILIEEAEKIVKAQKSRGADFDTGSLKERAKKLLAILVPLFANAFRRADELAVAMESRCYFPGEERSRMKPLAFKKRDYIAFVLVGAFFIFVATFDVIFV